MAFNERTGSRISEYRKGELSFSGPISSAGASGLSLNHVIRGGTGTHINHLKHFRGFMVIGATSSGSPAQRCSGWFGLMRYPAGVPVVGGDVEVAASRVLHPVPFATFQYPNTFPYEYNAVTLGPLEDLYLIVAPQYKDGNFEFVSQFAFNLRQVSV